MHDVSFIDFVVFFEYYFSRHINEEVIMIELNSFSFNYTVCIFFETSFFVERDYENQEDIEQ